VAESSRPVPPPKRGPLGKLVAAVLAFSFWLLLGMLGNIMFEWVCMKTVWPGEGPAHSVAMVEAELQGLEAEFAEGVFIRRPALLAREMAGAVGDKVYREWRLDGKVMELDRRASLAGGMGSFSADAHELSRGFQDYLRAAVAATEVYAIRLAVMVSALPVFLLAGLVAVVDGLGQRDLRRFGGGREKGQVYHLARGLVFPAFTLPWILYLSWPAAVRPGHFILPFALVFGFALWIAASSFKKYL
jgi:integrating conjugative element membrane protein (TIGR03747 family)